MAVPPHPLLARLDAALQRPLAHALLLFAFVLAFHGHSLSFGLIYDDHLLLNAPHARWFHSSWEYEGYYRPGEYLAYYRPLQALLFAPRLVSSVPAILHLENLVAGTLIVFLFGRVLLALGLGLRLVTLIEWVGVTLPTSMALFVWISQRTDWPTYALGLVLALWTITARLRPGVYLAAFVALAALALFAKESGVALLALAPVLLAARRRRGLALLALVLGLALFAGYSAIRASFVPDTARPVQTPVLFAARLVFGLVQATIYSWLPVSFTTNGLDLALGIVYGGSAFMGLAVLWRRQRPAAVALLTLWGAFALGTAVHPVPRNLVLPGLIVGAFACCGGARMLESARERGTRGLDVLLFAASLVSLATISTLASYALQDWIEPINTRLESEHYAPRHGLVHPVDMNIPFPPGAPDTTAKVRR